MSLGNNMQASYGFSANGVGFGNNNPLNGGLTLGSNFHISPSHQVNVKWQVNDWKSKDSIISIMLFAELELSFEENSMSFMKFMTIIITKLKIKRIIYQSHVPLITTFHSYNWI